MLILISQDFTDNIKLLLPVYFSKITGVSWNVMNET